MKKVTQAEFARLKDVSRKTVTMWKAKGLLSMAPDGLVKVEESEWLLADRPAVYRGGIAKGRAVSGGSEAARPAKDETPEEAADRIVNREGRAPYDHAEAVRIKENYLALLRQLEYDQKSGAVASIEDVAIALATECAIIRANYRALGARCAPRLAMLREATECQAVIDAEVDRILEDLTLDGGGADPADPELRRALQDRFAKPS